MLRGTVSEGNFSALSHLLLLHMLVQCEMWLGQMMALYAHGLCALGVFLRILNGLFNSRTNKMMKNTINVCVLLKCAFNGPQTCYLIDIAPSFIIIRKHKFFFHACTKKLFTSASEAVKCLHSFFIQYIRATDDDRLLSFSQRLYKIAIASKRFQIKR